MIRKLSILLLLIAAFAAPAAVPDQSSRWAAAKMDPKWRGQADSWIFRYTKTAAAYDRLAAAQANGVPAQFIFGFHVRESAASFAHHLHEGSPLRFRTRYVPRHRPAVWNPPNDWHSSAIDALYTYEGLHRRDWRNRQPALQAAESYNGLGYQAKGRVSPYLWSGTTIYTGGKYIRDGVFSPVVFDKQIGICAIFLRMRERGMALPSALTDRPAFRTAAPSLSP
jgi:lysozyme family protein